MSDVFVATTGSDTEGTGSIISPYQTIQKGIDELKIQGPGNTLYLRGGTYTEIPVLSSFLGTPNVRSISFGALNDATSWENSYAIRSYPGEWAVIDAAEYTDDSIIVLTGTPTTGGAGFIEISHLEIKNAHGSVGCAGIYTRGGPYKFRYLSIHDNTCDTGSNNPAGLACGNGVGATVIEYCYFKGNGYLWEGQTSSENSCNIEMYADYLYDWGNQKLYNENGFTTANHSNIIRYNYVHGGDTNLRTGVGIKHKSVQFLASNTWGEGVPVDENGWYDKGNKIHHNIVIDHSFSGIYSFTDFDQIYNNIVDGDGLEPTIQISSNGHNYRGPWHTVVYNNTSIDAFGAAFIFWNDPNGPELAGVDANYLEPYAFNNIASGTIFNDSTYPFNFSRYFTPTWDIDTLLHVENNYLYDTTSTGTDVGISVLTLVQLNALSNSNDNKSHDAVTPAIYAGISGGDQYKLNSAYAEYTILSTGGRGGNHPHLSGVTIPTYIGAVNPTDDAWVSGVISLSSISVLRDGTGDPDWIEGATPSPESSVLTSKGMKLIGISI